MQGSSETTRRLVFHGIGELAVESGPAPVAGEGEVLVEVDSVGLCRTDLYGFSGVNDRRQGAVDAAGVGLVMGHEAVGRVAALGAGVEGPPPGTAVAVNPIVWCGACESCRHGMENNCENRRVVGVEVALPGSYADTVVVPARNVVPFEGPAPIEWGALVEPIAVGGHGVALAGAPAGGSVLVFGGGLVGIGAALVARRLGAEKVLVIEPLAERRALIEGLGIDAADVGHGPDRRSFDAAVDCVGRPETLNGSLAAVVPGGTVVQVGIYEGEVPVAVPELVDLERLLRGSYAYLPEEFADLTRWIASGEVDLTALIGLEVGFDGVVGAFEAYADGSLDAVRTLFRPSI